MILNKVKNLVPISEDALQAQCISWFRFQYPKLYWRLVAIPNGGKRNVIEAVKLKRTGTLSGCWDLFLSVPYKGYSGLFIEMKVGKNVLTDNQISFMEANEEDYRFNVCYSLEQFQNVVREYLK